MMRGVSCRLRTVLQCESTFPCVSLALYPLLRFLLVPVSDFYRPRRFTEVDPAVPHHFRFFPLLPSLSPVESVIRNFVVIRYKEYRYEQEKKHEEWLARKHERDERLARGDEVGPEEPDPTAEVEIGLWSIVKFLLSTIVIVLLTGKFVTGGYLWDYDGKWVQAKTYFPVRSHSPSLLATHRWKLKRVRLSPAPFPDASDTRSSSSCLAKGPSLGMTDQIPTNHCTSP